MLPPVMHHLENPNHPTRLFRNESLRARGASVSVGAGQPGNQPLESNNIYKEINKQLQIMLNGSNAHSEISGKYLNIMIETDKTERYTSMISGNHYAC